MIIFHKNTVNTVTFENQERKNPNKSKGHDWVMEIGITQKAYVADFQIAIS